MINNMQYGTTNISSPIKVAIIGCGNIMQSVHFPTLHGRVDVEIKWLVDANAANLAKAALWYPTARQTSNLTDVEGVDAVLIATPPALHYEHVKSSLEKGWHVLVEKPLTVHFKKSQELVALAQVRGLNLCVNLNRRFFPAIKTLKKLTCDNSFGRIVSMKVFDGGRWTGGAGGGATYHSSLKLGGGGVLLETGSHMLDLGLYLLPASTTVHAIEYADDGITGLEAECRFSLSLIIDGKSGGIMHGLFSSIAPVEKKIEIQFEKAKAKVDLPSGNIIISDFDGIKIPIQSPVAMDGDPIMESFRASFDDFIKGCRNRNYNSIHRAASTLVSLETIEKCYHAKKGLLNPWGEKITALKTPYIGTNTQKKVIGIIGAGGFLGSRLFERLLRDGQYEPRPITHSSLGSFAVLRYTDAVAIGDAASFDFLRKKLIGADVVVNCAINTRGARQFAIQSTRAIAQNAAVTAAVVGARRFIQISTIAIHGLYLGRRGDMLQFDPTRSTYALAKYYSEQDVLRLCKKSGIDSTILRMGHIYGPYAPGWTVGQRDLVRSNALISIDSWQNPSNTVFVDNAVDAIISAIESPSALSGQVFYVADSPNKTWREFYEPLYMREQQDIGQVRDISFKDFRDIMEKKQTNVFHQMKSFIQEMASPMFKKDNLRALKGKREYQQLFQMIENIIPESGFRHIKKLLNKSAVLQDRSDVLKTLDGLLYDLACSYASSIELPISDTVKTLGYTPATSWSKARQVTMDWLSSIE